MAEHKEVIHDFDEEPLPSGKETVEMDNLMEKMFLLSDEDFKKVKQLALIGGKSIRDKYTRMAKEGELTSVKFLGISVRFSDVENAGPEEFTWPRFCACVGVRNVVEGFADATKRMIPSLSQVIGVTGCTIFDEWMLPMMAPGLNYAIRFVFDSVEEIADKKFVFKINEKSYQIPNHFKVYCMAAAILLDWSAHIASARVEKKKPNYTISSAKYYGSGMYNKVKGTYYHTIKSLNQRAVALSLKNDEAILLAALCGGKAGRSTGDPEAYLKGLVTIPKVKQDKVSKMMAQIGIKAPPAEEETTDDQ
jgi:hypothetical protein